MNVGSLRTGYNTLKPLAAMAPRGSQSAGAMAAKVTEQSASSKMDLFNLSVNNEIAKWQKQFGMIPKHSALPTATVKNAIAMKSLSKLEQNILNDVKDYRLRNCFIEISKGFNKIKKTGELPKDYPAVRDLENLILSSTHLDSQKDRVVCDELISQLQEVINNLNTKNKGMFWVKFAESETIIKKARDFAEIPLHSNGTAFPIKSKTLDAQKYLKEKNMAQAQNTKDFDEAMRNEGMINYFINGNPSAELKKNIYENYYLNRTRGDVAAPLKAIRDYYGTATFVPKKTTEDQADDILREFHAWNKAGGKNVNHEKVLDYNDYDTFLLENGAYAYAAPENFIRCRSRLVDIMEDFPILRHEKMHRNDKLQYKFMKGTTFGKFGTKEQFDFTKDGKILTEKKWFREEFQKAGIPKWHIDYAYKDRAEFLAVAAEGDPKKYSEEFKKVLAELGMPEWFFDIRKYKKYN